MFGAMRCVFAFLASLCVCVIGIAGASEDQADGVKRSKYEIAGSGTRRFEWDTDTGPLWIKILVEESNLGSSGAEVAEIFFPPDYQGESHPHELEIFYVLEGELGHIVNGVPHLLKPGMIGIVRAPDLVIHRSESKEGVRALVFWPLGNEVSALEDGEARVVPIQVDRKNKPRFGNDR